MADAPKQSHLIGLKSKGGLFGSNAGDGGINAVHFINAHLSGMMLRLITFFP